MHNLKQHATSCGMIAALSFGNGFRNVQGLLSRQQENGLNLGQQVGQDSVLASAGLVEGIKGDANVLHHGCRRGHRNVLGSVPAAATESRMSQTMSQRLELGKATRSGHMYQAGKPGSAVCGDSTKMQEPHTAPHVVCKHAC